MLQNIISNLIEWLSKDESMFELTFSTWIQLELTFIRDVASSGIDLVSKPIHLIHQIVRCDSLAMSDDDGRYQTSDGDGCSMDDIIYYSIGYLFHYLSSVLLVGEGIHSLG